MTAIHALQAQLSSLSISQRMIIEDSLNNAHLAHLFSEKSLSSEFITVINKTDASQSTKRFAHKMAKSGNLKKICDLLHKINEATLIEVERVNKVKADLSQYCEANEWKLLKEGHCFSKEFKTDCGELILICQVFNGVNPKNGNLVFACQFFKLLENNQIEELSGSPAKVIEIKEFCQMQRVLDEVPKETLSTINARLKTQNSRELKKVN